MTLRGAIQHFPLDTVLILLSETGKSGRLSVRGDEGGGALLISGGRPVSAEFEGARGTAALGGIFSVLRGEFAFEPLDAVEGGDLSGELDELLRTAAAERDRVAQIREVIPHEGTRFRLSERAAQGGQIVMSPDQWRTLLAADGDRDVAQIAERIGKPRFETQELLAALVRMGMVDTVVSPDAAGARAGGSFGDGALLEGETGDFPLETVVQLAGATRKTGRIEVRSAHGTASLAMADGRLVAASSDGESGEVALADALAARDGRFTFVPLGEAPAPELSGETVELLERAVGTRDQLAAAREAIPDPRSRFALSERASGQEQISLTPDQWRALTKIDGRRDLAALASELRLGRLRTLILAGELARGGFVDVIAPAEEEVRTPEPAQIAAVPAAEPEPITEIPAPPSEWAAAPLVEQEQPLAETPVDDTARDAAVDDRLAALTGLFGTPEPAPPPPAWEPAPAEPAASTEWTAPQWETAAEAPAEEAAAEIDPRLAAFALPPAEAPASEAAPAGEVAPPRPEPLPGTMASPIPRAAPLPGTMGAPIAATPAQPAPARPAAPAAPAAEPKKKGGLFGFGAKPAAAAPVAAAPAVSGTRSAQLATFANELVAGYNSGQYGKARVEDHMLSLLMRVDEQADPIDRPVPLANDRIDVDSIQAGALPEQQAVPYLALLVRQIYDDAERALGKDKARKGFKETRDRVFGRDQSLFAVPEIAARIPKV